MSILISTKLSSLSIAVIVRSSTIEPISKSSFITVSFTSSSQTEPSLIEIFDNKYFGFVVFKPSNIIAPIIFSLLLIGIFKLSCG